MFTFTALYTRHSSNWSSKASAVMPTELWLGIGARPVSVTHSLATCHAAFGPIWVRAVTSINYKQIKTKRRYVLWRYLLGSKCQVKTNLKLPWQLWIFLPIFLFYFFLKHLSGPESWILKPDWLIARAPAVLIFPSGPRVRTGHGRAKSFCS